MSNQISLFKDSKNKWQDHWKDMPEYNNIEANEPLITATFKFRSDEDFKIFNEKLKKYLYKGRKPFDGTQRKDMKSTWYPLKEKASKYIYRNES